MYDTVSITSLPILHPCGVYRSLVDEEVVFSVRHTQPLRDEDLDALQKLQILVKFTGKETMFFEASRVWVPYSFEIIVDETKPYKITLNIVMVKNQVKNKM
jgi:hypothetical protein